MTLRSVPHNPGQLRLVSSSLCADAPGMSSADQRVQPIRLVRRVIDVDGHAVGVSTAGRGVPLVMVHGFGVESMLYAQSLSRLVGLGFRVIAIDIPGHGESDGLHLSAALNEFVAVIDAAVQQLGIRRAVYMGHSLGGRLVAELVAMHPERALAVVLLDPIVGQPWDALRTWLRWFPPALMAYGAIAAVDVASTLPTLVDRRQALKIGSRIRGSITSLVTEPWNGLNVGSAVLRSGPSVAALDAMHDANVASFVVHATNDRLVPKRAASDTQQRLEATFVTVEDAGHSWMVRDPEALPSIVERLLDGALGAVLDHADLPRDLAREDAMARCIDPVHIGDLVEPVDVVLPSTRHSARLKFSVS